LDEKNAPIISLNFGGCALGGFAGHSNVQAATGRVGLLRRLIADFVQDFCNWRGRSRGIGTVPFVERIEEIVGGIIRQPDLAFAAGLPVLYQGSRVLHHDAVFAIAGRVN
jgi:hypothetical protein